MHPSLRLCSARVHTPLIHFVGRRQWPATPEAPHPHPSAPAEIKQVFSEFVKKFQSSASSDANSSAPKGQKGSAEGGQVYKEFWEAPARFWERDIQEAEIDAILSGGASLH